MNESRQGLVRYNNFLKNYATRTTKGASKSIDTNMLTSRDPYKNFSRLSSWIDTRRLDYLVQKSPKYFKFKFASDKELQEIYKLKETRFLIIDTSCCVLNIAVVSTCYFEVRKFYKKAFFIRL
jgi:hypothetical protein